jgi:branched-chain amino acid transport system substrate-binding protein
MYDDRRRVLKAAAAATLAGAMPVWSQGTGEVVFALTLPLSGVFSAVSQQQLDGFKDYFDHVNGSGGIRGRKVKLLIEDTQAKTDLSVAAYKKFMANDKPTVFHGDGTNFVRAGSQENTERFKVFMTSQSFASDLDGSAPYQYHFMAGPRYVEAADILMQFIKRDFKGSGKPRVALIHSASEFGRDPLEFIKKRSGELGLDLVLVNEMKFTGVDVATETIKLRQAKPDYTIIHGFGAAPIYAEILKLAREYKLETKFMGTFWEGSRSILRRAGDAADGFIGVANYSWNTAGQSAPMLKAIDDARRKRDPKYDGFPDIFYMNGWFNAMIMARATDLTLAAGKPLTGDNMRDAMRNAKDWDTGGIIGAPVTFRNNSIPMAQMVRFDAKRDMTPVPISEWIRLP